jgi:hypothetical protein
VLCALGGGVVTTTADREDAAAIEARWPGTAAQFGEARGFHARAAAWALSEGGARGLIVAPAGYPCDPDPHAAALAASPAARVLLADIDEEVAWVNQKYLGAEPRVTVVQTGAASPAKLLSRRETRKLPRPLCLLIPFAVMMLPAGVAKAALGAYGELLAAGSIVALSLWTPDGGPAGAEFLQDWGRRVAPAYAHSADDVAGWLKAAGMEAIREPRDLRARAGREWAEEDLSRQSPGRMTAAVARVL